MTSIDLDLSWCNSASDTGSKKNLYFYFGTVDSYTDLHMVVRFSYSPDQLKNGDNLEYAECRPIQRFQDLSRLFKTEINRPLYARTEAFNKTYSQSDLLYPCGFRALTALQRTNGVTLADLILSDKEGSTIPITDTDLTWNADQSSLKMEQSNLVEYSKRKCFVLLEQYLSLIRSSSIYNNLKYRGYYTCSSQFSNKMKLRVDGSPLHDVFFSSIFYSKNFRVMIISQPDTISAINNFLAFAIAILCVVVVGFVFMLYKGKLIF